jgi:indolepyruvate ferredoxin oxidoreductase
VKAAEAARAPGRCGLAESVARYLFKLMAYKDEYEVARLYTDGNFLKQVRGELGGDKLRFEFHLAPPLLARRDPVTGLPRKMSFGPWMMSAFKVLAKLKFLRGTAFDIFGYSEERKTERKLIADYEAMLDEILAKLTPDNHAHRGRACGDPGEDPRLRPCEGAAPGRRQGRRGGAAGAVPVRRAAAPEGRGVAVAV